MRNKISIILSLCVIFNFFTTQSLMAQKNRKGKEAAIVGAGIIGGLIAAKIAVEEIKEQLESEAVTHILSTYPEIKEFRLKCLFENRTASVSREEDVDDASEKLWFFVILQYGWDNPAVR